MAGCCGLGGDWLTVGMAVLRVVVGVSTVAAFQLDILWSKEQILVIVIVLGKPSKIKSRQISELVISRRGFAYIYIYPLPLLYSLQLMFTL